jgi:hypothetical protein
MGKMVLKSPKSGQKGKIFGQNKRAPILAELYIKMNLD